MKNNMLVCMVVILLVILGVSAFTANTVKAQEDDSVDLQVIKKLDAILENQKTILEDLGALKEEIGILKIRISQRI